MNADAGLAQNILGLHLMFLFPRGKKIEKDWPLAAADKMTTNPDTWGGEGSYLLPPDVTLPDMLKLPSYKVR